MKAPAGTGTAMSFSVDAWDASYGSSGDGEVDLGQSDATLHLDVELLEDQWRPLDGPAGMPAPQSVLFVDGVRRIDARVWVDDPALPGAASAGLCASYAAGVVCCCDGKAHLLATAVRHGTFSTAPQTTDIVTWAATYVARMSPSVPGTPQMTGLSLALQNRLGELEVATALDARASSTCGAGGADLLVVDGPLRGRSHLPRIIGFIKTHRTEYLPPALHALVGRLGPTQRTPVFVIGSSWDRHTWYLRLPCLPGGPWAGVVRVECSADMAPADAIALADLSQATLCRFASEEYKDARAPQNLYPIAGLERELRRRLGDQQLLYRALRQAAA